MSTWVKWVQRQIGTEEKRVLGANWCRWKVSGIGTYGHWNKRALGAEWVIWHALSALVPLFPSAHLPPVPFASVPICPSAYLLQSLFALVPICPSACCARAHFPQAPICIRLVLHLSQKPICSHAHFCWCPLLSLPISPVSIFLNAILVPYKNVCSHAVP